MSEISDNNIVRLAGRICSEPQISHKIYGETYFKIYLSVRRLSGRDDILPLTVSERLLSGYLPREGDTAQLSGQYRSYNNYTGVGSKLILTVFVRELYITPGENTEILYKSNPNQIYLNGFICKPPTYRTTPLCREISDILLAVNRSYRKSDYIPCIAWGRNARYIESLPVGTKIKIHGRIQSREYQKRISDDETISKTAYEVSISKLEI